jgi:hypothetical protein
LFEQLVRARTGLALDQTNLAMDEILHAPDSQRVARANDDSLFPGCEVDEKHRSAWQRAPHEWEVEFMCRLVAQVKASDMYLAPPKSLERCHA